MSGGQTPKESMPILSLSEVSNRRYGQRGGAHRFAKGTPWPFAIETKIATRIAAIAAGLDDHSTCARPCRYHTRSGQPRLSTVLWNRPDRPDAHGGGENPAILHAADHIGGCYQAFCWESPRIHWPVSRRPRATLPIGIIGNVRVAIVVSRSCRRLKNYFLQWPCAAQITVSAIVWRLVEFDYGVQQEFACIGNWYICICMFVRSHTGNR